jgi:propanol-preferring alcohol dehydrogenase
MPTTDGLAMELEAPGARLQLRQRPLVEPGAGQVLVKIAACGVCRTDLHLIDGELPDIHYPIVPGHQIVGRVIARGPGVEQPQFGARVGIPWLGHSCGHCDDCWRGDENLCDQAGFTGYQLDGGFATHCIAEAAYTLALPNGFDDLAVAPLLCAGLIGYRSLKACSDARHIGFYGFGAAAHVIAQLAVWQGRQVYGFTRPGDGAAQAMAREFGACWVGGSDEMPPRPLDAAIIFAAAGELVPTALRAVRKGGRVVCGGIHMSDIPSFPYSLLWGERSLQSIANLTRRDAREFLELAPKVPIRTQTHLYPLEHANDALDDLRQGRITGAAVLTM